MDRFRNGGDLKCEYITNSKQTENSGKLKYFKLENSRY